MAEISWEENNSKTMNYDQSNPKTKKKILIRASIIIGAILLGFSLYSLISTSLFLKKAKKAEGIVLELIASKDSENETLYAPVFEFKDQSGQSYVIRSSTYTNDYVFKVGQKVEVLYDPSSPQKARINSFFNIWGFVVVLGGIGGVFFIVGVVLLKMKKVKGTGKS